ncbi:MAG: AEC family transporter [Pseudomonadota bacterium]
MQALLDVILPVFLVIGFGYVCVWRGLFPASGVDVLMNFAQRLAIPCLLFHAIANIDLTQGFDLAMLGSFYAGAASGFALGMAGAYYLFGRDLEDAVAIGFACLFSNSVLLGLSINERAFGADAMANAYAIVAFHSPFCYGLGITAMEIVRGRADTPLGTAKRVLTAMFSNALVLAIFAGFAVNLAGLTIPTVLDDALLLVIRAALPTALFALGGVLVSYRPEGDMRVIAMVCVIALLIHPAITFGLGNALGVTDPGLQIAVLTSAMAPGVNAYIFASMYGRAQRVAASSVLAATSISVITAWFWLILL